MVVAQEDGNEAGQRHRAKFEQDTCKEVAECTAGAQGPAAQGLALQQVARDDEPVTVMKAELASRRGIYGIAT